MINYNVKNKQAVRQLLDNLFAELPSREKDVLVRRNQLLNELSKRETLKEIGDEYNITRERVRQIENEGIKKLLKNLSTKKELMQMIEDDVMLYLERNGGVVLEQHMLENFVNQLDLEHYNENSVLFVLNHLLDSVDQNGENEDFYKYWIRKDFDVDHLSELFQNLATHFEDKKVSIATKDLMGHLKEVELVKSNMNVYNSYLDKHDDLEIENLLENYLSLSKAIEKNILDKWGLAHWPDIKPKKLSEKIFLIFQCDNKPLHFSNVADKINGAGFDKKNICAATVHNELIANKEYTLVGRGIYALKEWGYESGTVADVIEKILQDKGPMSKDDIYAAVLKQRMVNKSTIYLSLINKEKFIKADGNKFTLKA